MTTVLILVGFAALIVTERVDTALRRRRARIIRDGLVDEYAARRQEAPTCDRHPITPAAVTVDHADGTTSEWCGRCWRTHRADVLRDPRVRSITDRRVTA